MQAASYPIASAPSATCSAKQLSPWLRKASSNRLGSSLIGTAAGPETGAASPRACRHDACGIRQEPEGVEVGAGQGWGGGEVIEEKGNLSNKNTALVKCLRIYFFC